MNKEIRNAIFKQVAAEPFAQKFGLQLIDIQEGYAKMEMVFTQDLENMFGMAHGGALFALIDEAFEVASNSHGTIALALNLNVTFLETPSINSLLIAEAKEESRTKRTASYRIEVLQKDENGDRKIALCQALVYRKDKSLSFLEEEAK